MRWKESSATLTLTKQVDLMMSLVGCRNTVQNSWLQTSPACLISPWNRPISLPAPSLPQSLLSQSRQRSGQVPECITPSVPDPNCYKNLLQAAGPRTNQKQHLLFPGPIPVSLQVKQVNWGCHFPSVLYCTVTPGTVGQLCVDAGHRLQLCL